ncbi:hypothetical protein EV426DRAFT_80190 [Tirmania nivea]|nr:hypothetical protein EV426DRAFT_80190 [Tirmania nivea]
MPLFLQTASDTARLIRQSRYLRIISCTTYHCLLIYTIHLLTYSTPLPTYYLLPRPRRSIAITYSSAKPTPIHWHILPSDANFESCLRFLFPLLLSLSVVCSTLIVTALHLFFCLLHLHCSSSIAE